MDHGTPPIFKRGLPPLARLLLYVSTALLLSIVDLRLQSLEALRQALTVITYPLQIAAAAPASAWANLSGYFTSLHDLEADNRRLRAAQLKANLELGELRWQAQENQRLRALVELGGRIEARSQVASILYAARDPYSRKVILSKGTAHGIAPGQVVLDERGIIGQVSRVFPLLSEVSLLSDRNMSIPVRVQRNGLRAVLAGSSQGWLELRFLPANVDVQPGDELVTSGLDGIYLPGLPVARVLSVSREEAQGFAGIRCAPLAGVEQHGEVLVVSRESRLPPQPEDSVEPVPSRRNKARARGG